ncbi:MAG TPA: transferrin-binding protein-like solute binding protein [Novosphingobium sp.]
MKRITSAQAGALMIGLALAGCGGAGSGSVVSTPTPTPASYTKVIDMTGDRTFQTAGVRYANTDPTSYINGTAQSFGSGIAVAYTASTDSYKLTAPDGTTTTVSPQNAQPAPSDAPNDRYWSNQDTFEVREFIALTVPKVNGVALSYTVIASWSRLERSKDSGYQNYLAVAGAPTIPSDMPRSGNATYATTVSGGVMQNGSGYGLGPGSSATFAADFGRNTVATSLTLVSVADAGSAAIPFGTFNGSGMISSTGPGFEGMLSGNGTTGTFAGAFFGPKAVEMAYAWYLNGGNLSAAGTVVGVKK